MDPPTPVKGGPPSPSKVGSPTKLPKVIKEDNNEEEEEGKANEPE